MMCTYRFFMAINKLWLMDFTPAQQKLLLLSAAAAGAGANFNAPITGVLYATEFTSKLFAAEDSAVVEAKDQAKLANLQVLLLSIASTLGVLVIRSGFFVSPVKSSLDWGKGFGMAYNPATTLALYSLLGVFAGAANP
jgi:H+/Cl- antiporter ClcA